MKDNSKLIKKFNLPSYIKGKSFAEASKAIENKFKDRSDKYSMETKDILMKRLAEAQEYTKLQEQSNDTSNQMFTGGDVASAGKPGANSYAQAAMTTFDLGKGAFGDTGIETNGSVDMNPGEVKKGMYALDGGLKGAQAGMAFGPIGAAVGGGVGSILGGLQGAKLKKDATEASQNNAIKTSNMFDNSYALGGNVDPIKGIKIPSAETSIEPMVDPNRIIQEQIGDGTTNNITQAYANEQYDINRDKAYKNAFSTWREGKTGNTRNDSFTQASPQYREFWDKTKAEYGKNNPRPVITEYAKGGYTNDYADGDLMSILDQTGLQSEGITSLNPFGTYIPKKESYQGTTPGLNENSLKGIENLSKLPQNKSAQGLPKADLSGFKRVGIEAARLAPVAMNAYQLAKLDKPDYESLNKLDSRYKKDIADNASTINTINSNFNSSFAKEGSGGSLSSYLANRQAAELSKLKAIDQGVKSDRQINRSENSREQQFNLGVDRTNLQQTNRENDINARNEGNYDTQKSRLLSQLGTDIGSIGKEQTFKQMVKDSGICYDTSGAYICGSSQRLSSEQLDEIKSETNQKAKGGMINSNEMFSSYLDYLKNK